MQKIKLKKKESNRILLNLKKCRVMPKPKQIKHIVFHKDFDKGMRLVLCHKCGYPNMFMGFALFDRCKICNSKKIEIYDMKHLDKFIIKIQEIYIKRKKWSK